MNFSTGHPVVDAVGKLQLTGNLVHHSWYQHIRYSNKRGEFTDPWAVLILADIVYWYRPIEIRDEQSGHLTGYRKKFSEDKLQRSPSAFSELLHCSEKVAREALTLLESLEVIDIELRSVSTGFGTVPTAMFIGLNPDQLYKITHNTSKPETIEKSLLPKSVRRVAHLGNKAIPNGQEVMPKSVSSDAQMGDSSIYRDFSKDFSHTSPLPPQGELERERNFDCLDNPPANPPAGSTNLIQREQHTYKGARDNNAVKTQGSDTSNAISNESNQANKNCGGIAASQQNKTNHKPEGDKFFGQVREQERQRSFATRMQRSLIPIEEMEPWRSPELYQEFEAYLLEETKKWAKNGNPASMVALKLKNISTGKEPKTEFTEWKARRDAAKTKHIQVQAKIATTETLTPEEEAWKEVVAAIHHANEYGLELYVRCDGGTWGLQTNFTSKNKSWNGKIKELIQKFPLHTLPVEFRDLGYAKCYPSLVAQFPHLHFPAPLSD